MGRIVAIGGGELDTTHRINRYIVELSGKKIRSFSLLAQPAATQKVILSVFVRSLRSSAVL